MWGLYGGSSFRAAIKTIPNAHTLEACAIYVRIYSGIEPLMMLNSLAAPFFVPPSPVFLYITAWMRAEDESLKALCIWSFILIISDNFCKCFFFLNEDLASKLLPFRDRTSLDFLLLSATPSNAMCTRIYGIPSIFMRVLYFYIVSLSGFKSLWAKRILHIRKTR